MQDQNNFSTGRRKRMPDMLKVMILGDASVGKTTILNQYVNREFSSNYKPTIGSDFMSKQAEVDGTFITLQLWDTAGQERYQSLGPTFYRGANCCIFVYDVTNLNSLTNLEKWYQGFVDQLKPPEISDFPFVLLGNKCDLDHNVDQKIIDDFVSTHGSIEHFFVSAKTSENSAVAFDTLIRKTIFKQKSCEEFQVNIEKKEVIASPPAKSSCC